MATDYGARFSKAVGCTRHAMGGAAEGLGIEALAGDTEMVTIFDDFDGIVEADQFGVATNWETIGTMLYDAGVPGTDYVHMNDPNSQVDCASEIVLVPGDTADTGGHVAFDSVAGAVSAAVSMHEFKYLWIPVLGTSATILDGTTWLMAMRVGFQSGDATAIGAASGDWDGKAFIGYCTTGDANVLVPTTGVPDVATQTGPIFGFGITETGQIIGHSQRTANTALAEGTNYTTILGAGGVDGNTGNGATAANQKMWFDLAVKLEITDMSDDDDNGYTHFYWRRVLPGQPLGDWLHHPTVLENQTPNPASVMVPCIEAINGPAVVQECAVGWDWVVYARDRINR